MKRRTPAPPGAIPTLLGMFERELRFYREVAPEVPVRTPALRGWSCEADVIRLELEDLSAWDEGGDPVAIASELRKLHRRWEGAADDRWPWLNRAGAAAEEIGRLYDRVWRDLRRREDLTDPVRTLGDSLAGRVAALERDESARGPRTLVHGDAAATNVRTSATGEIVLLDWEDVRTAQGEVDLTGLLLSSAAPGAWDDVIDAYRPDRAALLACLPANAAQAILGLADQPPGSAAALGWVARLEAAAAMLNQRWP